MRTVHNSINGFAFCIEFTPAYCFFLSLLGLGDEIQYQSTLCILVFLKPNSKCVFGVFMLTPEAYNKKRSEFLRFFSFAPSIFFHMKIFRNRNVSYYRVQRVKTSIIRLQTLKTLLNSFSIFISSIF